MTPLESWLTTLKATKGAELTPEYETGVIAGFEKAISIARECVEPLNGEGMTLAERFFQMGRASVVRCLEGWGGK